jgi:AcrR family transcriptional regulator
LEAAARILNNPGKAEFNTNAIAELAGVSIGTLYQYFPDKNAILLALAHEQFHDGTQAVLKALAEIAESAPELRSAQDPVRKVVRPMIHAFGGRQRTRKYLLEGLIANGLTAELNRPIESIILFLNKTYGSMNLTPVRLFVMTRAVAGLLRMAVLEESVWLEDPAFEDEFVALIHHYLDSSEA